MCKTPGAECKPLEEDGNIPMEEDIEPDNMSEDESEDTVTDETYFTDSSTDNGNRSDTDAESASGNRVTPEMVVWLMLKEQGLITEERYVQRPEKCTENIRSLIPTIPRSNSWDTIHSSGSEDLNNSEDFAVEMPLDLSVKVSDDNTVEPSNNEVDGQSKETFKEVGIKENDSDPVMSENVKKQSDEEMSVVIKQVAVSDVIPKVNNEEEEILKERQPLKETKQDNEEIKETMHNTLALSNQNDLSQEQQQNECENVLSSETTKEETINGDSTSGPYAVLECDSNISTVTRIMHEKEGQRLSEDYNIATEEMTNTLNEINPELKKTANKSVNKIEEYNNDMGNGKQDVELTETGNSTEESINMLNEDSGKKTKSFKYILKTLVKEKRITEEKEKPISDKYGEGFVKVLKTYVNDLDDYYDDNKAVHLFNDDDDVLKTFALFLNFYSPSAYKYVTETYYTPLPDHKKLCSWYLKDNEEPGLSEKAFKILKQKSLKKRQTCALMFCDVYLRNEGCYWYDQVDYGGGINDDHMDKAVMVYVFILVSLDEDWKMPIGYIFARYIPAESQAELIRVCLTECYNAGADVVAVTLEKPTPAEFLGCSFQDPQNLKTTFKHPVCDREVAVWIDPCLALKSARHTLKVKGVLKDNKGDIIRWNLLRRLRRLHSNNTISYENEALLLMRNPIAKIGLTTETFSKSLAVALQLGEEFLPQSFTDTEPTQKYILYINYLYEVFNSKIRNSGEIWRSLNKVRNYLLGVFCNRENELSLFDDDNLDWGDKRIGYRFFIEGKSACGLIGFLICIESFKHLYTTLVEKEQRLTHLNTHRLCKVHAENFVKNLRAHTYIDPDDFTGDCFQSFYKKLFGILEENPHFSDRQVSLERWPLMDRYPPAVVIKLTTGKRAYDDVYSSQYALKRLRKTSRKDRATQLVREYSRSLDTEIDLSAKQHMVGYLAGWIAARLARCLRCEPCIDALCTHKKLWFHKYITLKRLNRVCLPSEALFRVCWECERVLKQKGSVAKLRCLVLRRLAPRLPWKHPRSVQRCHQIQLTRPVIAKYIPLRIKAPFSAGENKRLIKMFRMSKNMAKDGMFDDIDEMMDGSIWSEESDEFNED